jgi:glycosyltransferase involved in cell wall biosynthesis
VRRRCLAVAVAPLHDVYRDLLNGLQGHGWDIEAALMSLPPVRDDAVRSWIDSQLAARNRAMRNAARLARRARREMQLAAWASTRFRDFEQAIASTRFDVALVITDVAPTGLARLFARAPMPVLFVSLVALAQELRHRRALAVLRCLRRFTARLHPGVLRAIEPSRIQSVVCPSRSWRAAAVEAGVPEAAAHVVHLGVSLPVPTPAPRAMVRSPARLLWVGRLSPEKGLHLFLDALPLLCGHTAVHLTAIASAGPAAYAREILERLETPALRGIVELRPAIPRDELIAAFRDYDLLLFHSVFAEPVAHVMLHAAASGLGVVGPASRCEHSLLRDDDTATCYSSPSPAHVSDAIGRALHDDGRRTRLAARLQQEVRSGHDLAVTIARFDELLQQLVAAGGEAAYA